MNLNIAPDGHIWNSYSGPIMWFKALYHMWLLPSNVVTWWRIKIPFRIWQPANTGKPVSREHWILWLPKASLLTRLLLLTCSKNVTENEEGVRLILVLEMSGKGSCSDAFVLLFGQVNNRGTTVVIIMRHDVTIWKRFPYYWPFVRSIPLTEGL